MYYIDYVHLVRKRHRMKNRTRYTRKMAGIE